MTFAPQSVYGAFPKYIMVMMFGLKGVFLLFPRMPSFASALILPQYSTRTFHRPLSIRDRHGEPQTRGHNLFASPQSQKYEESKHEHEQKYIPIIVTSDSLPPPERGIIIVDPFSPFHGEVLIDRAVHDYGVGVVRVLSPYMARGFQKNSRIAGEDEVDYHARTAPLTDPELSKWLTSIPFSIVAVLCESDSGLDYAERLAVAIDKHGQKNSFQGGHRLLQNGYNVARRDKFEMNRVCNEAGAPTAKQALCVSPQDAVDKSIEFGLVSSGSTAVIIKPRRGVASDRVSLCRTPEEVETATDDILSAMVFGTHETQHNTILMQEYVPGSEYAVDVVSKDGVHKTAAIWIYDRTSTAEDGSNPFAYTSGKLVSSDDPRYPTDDIVNYVTSCLDALEVHWGMSHTEVKVTPNGEVRLMEVNVRQQNDNFGPLCAACIGYDALRLCLSAYLDENENDSDETKVNLFELVPDQPILQNSGMIVNLACYVDGVVEAINHMEKIENLESTMSMQLYPAFAIGNTVSRTKDIRTDCGWVHLVHEDEETMMKDYIEILRLMPTMFDVEKSTLKTEMVR